MDIIKFLKKQRLYDKALRYTMKAYGLDPEDAKEYYKSYESSPTIKGFFEFHKTEEGKEFWIELDNQFKQRNGSSIIA